MATASFSITTSGEESAGVGYVRMSVGEVEVLPTVEDMVIADLLLVAIGKDSGTLGCSGDSWTFYLL